MVNLRSGVFPLVSQIREWCVKVLLFWSLTLGHVHCVQFSGVDESRCTIRQYPLIHRVEETLCGENVLTYEEKLKLHILSLL